MILKAKQTLLMTGDSITDCERLRPLGKPDWWLGNGYVAMVNALLNARYPETPVDPGIMRRPGPSQSDRAHDHRPIVSERDWICLVTQ